MAGRRGFRPAGHRGSGPGAAVVPSGCRLSGLSGRHNASAGSGRVRPGSGRAAPSLRPDGRDPESHSTPLPARTAGQKLGFPRFQGRQRCGSIAVVSGVRLATACPDLIRASRGQVLDALQGKLPIDNSEHNIYIYA